MKVLQRIFIPYDSSNNGNIDPKFLLASYFAITFICFLIFIWGIFKYYSYKKENSSWNKIDFWDYMSPFNYVTPTLLALSNTVYIIVNIVVWFICLVEIIKCSL